MKKFYKDDQNKVFAGVCAGLAEYMELDVSLVRIVTAILILGVRHALIVYIIAAFVLPKKSSLENDDVIDVDSRDTYY